MSTKYVLFYESGSDLATKAPLHFPAHAALGQAYHDRGALVAYGPFANAQAEGSMAVFSTREAAEEFVREDPFVLNGVVGNWTIREWNEAFLP